MEKLLAVYKRTIFQSVQYGVSIAVYETDEELVTITGTALPTLKKIKYEFVGEWVNHPKFGRQFKAASFEEMVSSDSESIIDYLTSGLIKGIGPVTARNIVASFGIDTLDILDRDINRLKEVKGISDGKLIQISESYTLARASRDVALTLRKYGIGPKLSAEVYLKFKADAMNVIRTKPFLLCQVNGISFIQADGIGEKTRQYCTDYERFKTCAKYVLLKNEQNEMQSIIGNRTSGSTAMEKNDFGKCMLTLLRGEGVNEEFVCKNTIQMIKDKELFYRKNVDGKEVMILPGIYRIEQAIAENIARICASGIKPLEGINEKIKEAESALNITLSLRQIMAVRNAFQNAFSIIQGAPGTGKTTTIKVIAWLHEHYENKDSIFLAPTGKAAARVRETGWNAQTIHSGLGITPEKINDVTYDEIIYNDCLIGIDEFSMVDARLAYRLFSAIGKCRVVCIGDPDQLPSVGAGSVLRDMLETNLPITTLDSVYRTVTGSDIALNCSKIRNGREDLFTGNGFSFIEADSINELECETIRAYLYKVKKYGVENVMLLSPYKEHECGVNELNRKIQKLMNPDNVDDKIFRYGDKYFRIGDPVLNMVNDSMLGIVNGDIGTVVDICKKDGEDVAVIKYATTVVSYTKDNCSDLTLAYALTVHKAQGSEAKCVILCCHSKFSLLQKRNLVYTGISRGKEDVVVVGQWEALCKAIATEDKSKRITTLKEQIKMHFSEFVSATYVTA